MENQQVVKGWTLSLALMWLGHFVVDFMVGIWPAYKTLMGLDLAKAGLILGISGFVGDGMQFFFGLLGDKGFRKRLVLLGIFLAASTSLLVYTQSYWLLFLLMLSAYLGSGAFHPAAVSNVTALLPNRKGLLVTTFVSGGMCGLSLSQFGFTHIYHETGGQTLLLLIPSALVFLSVLLGKFPQSNQRAIASRSVKEMVGILLIHRRALGPLYLAQVCQQAVLFGFIFLLPDLLKARGYEEWVYMGGGNFFYILGTSCMLVPAGYLSDKYSQKSVLLLALGASLVLLYGFLIYPPSSTTLLFIFLFTFGACMGVVNPLGIAFANRIVGQQASLVSALFMGCVWCVAHCLGPACGGFLSTCFTTEALVKTLSIQGALLLLSLTLTSLAPNLQSQNVEQV